MNKRAFTLVELIVVVTILAILATIGFVSYSGYLNGVRDTNRIASLNSISDGLELYRTKNELPNPDDFIRVESGTQILARQGYLGANVIQTIEYSKAGKDPKDDIYYSYYLSDNKKYYQLMTYLEENFYLDTHTDIVPLSNAAVSYQNRYPKVFGDRLGIMLDSDNKPIQDNSGFTQSGYINIANVENNILKAVINDDMILTGSGTDFQKIEKVIEDGGKFWTVSDDSLVSTEPLDDWREIDPNCPFENIEIAGKKWAGCNSNQGRGTASSSGLDPEFNTLWGSHYLAENMQTACTNGWRLPTNDDWVGLEAHLGCSDTSIGPSICPGLGYLGHAGMTANNNLFEALKIPMASFRNTNNDFFGTGSAAWLWTFTPSQVFSGHFIGRYFASGTNEVIRGHISPNMSLAVRCIHD